MRIDLYTKGVLTVIAVLPAVIAVRPYVSPDAVVQAQGPFAGMQWASKCSDCFFYNKTGEIWDYSGGKVVYKAQLTKLGDPLK